MGKNSCLKRPSFKIQRTSLLARCYPWRLSWYPWTQGIQKCRQKGTRSGHPNQRYYDTHLKRNITDGRRNRSPISTNTVVNIYAPSGSSNGVERGNFSNTELVYLLRHLPHNYIFGGDFNCVLSPLNCTGGFRPCKTIEVFVKNPHLIDFWANTFNRAIFTNYTTNSASRIGRLCFPPNLFQNKMGTEILATVFTDHLVAALLITMNIPILHVGRNCWKLNTRLLCDVDIIQRLKEQSLTWKTTKGRCKAIDIWWESH
jgi:hypothetical protein